jgi:hypothetical protein
LYGMSEQNDWLKGHVAPFLLNISLGEQRNIRLSVCRSKKLSNQILVLLNLKEFATTDIDEAAIAPAASIGLRSPKAATGIRIML